MQKLKNYFDNILFHPIQHVDFFLTRACNLRCTYCFVYGEKDGHCPKSVIDRFLDVVLMLTHGSKSCSITLFGGEPLLVFDRLVYFVENAQKRGLSLKYSITTNGTLINDEMVKYLAGKGIMLLLSVDGGKKSHDKHRCYPDGNGSFDDIIKNLDLLRKYQGWTGVRVTPTPETIPLLVSDLKELHSYGVNQFIVGPATGIKWTKHSIDMFSHQTIETSQWYASLKKTGDPIKLSFAEADKESSYTYYGCGAGRARAAIDIDGTIYGCAKLASAHKSGSGVMSIGNVFDDVPISSPINRAALFNKSLWERKRCEKCNILSTCHGGCPAANYTSTGSMYKQPDYECRMNKVVQKAKVEIQKIVS